MDSGASEIEVVLCFSFPGEMKTKKKAEGKAGMI